MSKIRILSIDGGGIRGIIPGTILQIIEEKIQVYTGDPEARLVDFVDFIAGTSTGAIIGCGMLAPSSRDPGRPQYQLKEIVDWYHQKGGEIFNKPFLHKLKSLWGVLDEKYPNTALKASLKEQFGDALMSGLLKPCLVTAYEIEVRKSMFITQHNAAISPDANFLVRDAVLASCSAPTYFEAIKVPSLTEEDHVLIDGGVFANNPAMCAYAEVRKLTFGDIINPTSEDMLLVSLGTGFVNEGYPYKKAKNFGFINWIRPLISILMSGNAEIVSYQLKWLFDAGLQPESFIRIEPDLLHAKVDLDDASTINMNALREAALNYVAKNEALIDAIVVKLVKNP
ncbi:MAG: patatin-like phospholipase family protein [Anditalea sp.]